MTLLEGVIRATTVLTSSVATVGSVLVHHDPETGKDSVNVLPAIVWCYGLSVIGCSLSRGEVFSQCVKGVFSILGG